MVNRSLTDIISTYGMKHVQYLVYLAMLPLIVGAGPGEEQQAVRRLLGNLIEDAKIATTRNDGELVVIDLASLQVTMLGKYPGGGKFGKISRVWWAPAATHLCYSHEGKGYIFDMASVRKQRFLSSWKDVQSPTWWRDPDTEEDYLTFMDHNGKDWYKEGGASPGKTYLYDIRRKKVSELADFPCDGGLSVDGTHLADAYGGCLLVDLTANKYHVLNRGRQACNASLNPDGRYQLMHLFLPHDHFGIRDKYDRVLWQIKRPMGSGEWQTPRWSTHPDYCMATAKFGSEYKLVLVQISSQEMVVLHSVEGSFRAPHLHLQFEPNRSGSAGLTLTKAREIFEQTSRMEASQAKSIYEQLVAEFPLDVVGVRSQEKLNSADFAHELKADAILGKIREKIEKLKPPKEGLSIYNNPGFFNRNQASLVQLVGLCSQLNANFSKTKAAELARKLTASFQLPQVAYADANVELEVEATITAVSVVPRYEQIAPYTAVLTWIEYRVDRVQSGVLDAPKIMVVHWGMLDGKHTAAAGWKPGIRQRLKVDLFDAHPELERISRAQEAFEDLLLNEYWALEATPLE